MEMGIQSMHMLRAAGPMVTLVGKSFELSPLIRWLMAGALEILERTRLAIE
jgi:hypothetical protein